MHVARPGEARRDETAEMSGIDGSRASPSRASGEGQTPAAGEPVRAVGRQSLGRVSFRGRPRRRRLGRSDVGPRSWRHGSCFGPICRPLYLNHGYNFFAPQPAPSTLLALRGGTRRRDHDPRAARLDRSIQPRLLYHRYLLLTEHIGVAPPDMLTALVQVVRAASLPQIWRLARRPDARDPLPADDGDGPQRRHASMSRSAMKKCS